MPAGAEPDATEVVADALPATALLAPVVVPIAVVLVPVEVVAAALEAGARVVDAAAEPVTVVATPLDEVAALLVAAGVLVALLPPQAARMAVTALPAIPVRKARRVNGGEQCEVVCTRSLLITKHYREVVAIYMPHGVYGIALLIEKERYF